MPVDTSTHTIKPRSPNTVDHTPVFQAVIADRCAAWDGLLRLRVANDRQARAVARTALRAAAYALAPSLRDDAHGVRAFVVRTLLARTRPAGLHPRRSWARAVLVDAITAADRKDDDQGLRAAVNSLAGSKLASSTTLPGALARAVLRREASVRRGLDRLLAANMGLVRNDVSRYLAGRSDVLGLERADLEQEGALGLLHAIRTFDPSRGFAVSTYAADWIRAAVRRAVADTAATVRAPVGLVEAMAKINAVRREHPGVELTVNELAALTGKTKSRVRTALERYPMTMSADTPMSGPSAGGSHGGDARSRGAVEAGATFLDRLEDPNPWDAAELIAREQMRGILHREVSRLSPREAGVLRARYLSDGAGGDDAQHTVRDGVTTFEAIGRTMGVSRERVRQIEGYALRTIRRRVAFAEGRRTGEQAKLFAVGAS